MKEKEILESEAFVKQPVDDINEQITKSKEQIIVLNGGRGCGKTTVLLSREHDSLNTDNLAIYTRFEPFGFSIDYPRQDKTTIHSYYELLFSLQLLSRYKSKKQLNESEQLLYHHIDNLRMNVLKKILYGDTSSIPKIEESYSEEVIEMFKKAFDKDKLTLMIDRFDWMDNRSKTSQVCISSFFDKFDKVILTTDDVQYSSTYPTISVSYGKNIDITEEILKRFCALNNSTKEFEADKFDPEDVNINTIAYLFERANGNISLMKNIISAMTYHCSSEGAIVTEEDLIQRYKDITDEKVKIFTKTNNFSINSGARFHI